MVPTCGSVIGTQSLIVRESQFLLETSGMHVISMVGCCQNVFDTTSFGTNPGASIGNLDFWPTLEKSNFEGVNFYCPGFGS
jgi:hypothetical protein